MHLLGIDLSCTGCTTMPFASGGRDVTPMMSFSNGRTRRTGYRGLEVYEGP